MSRVEDVILIGRDLGDCFLGSILGGYVILVEGFYVFCHTHAILNVIYYVAMLRKYFV